MWAGWEGRTAPQYANTIVSVLTYAHVDAIMLIELIVADDVLLEES